VKISLVTPCFNSADFLEETIRSVLAQDIPDLEYFIIDGGSTDGTVDIIRRYADRLSGWTSEKDSGQVDALNKGFARATGEIVGFINADDVLLPGALQAVLQAFTRRPEVELVYGEVEWIDAEGRATGSHAGEISSLEEALDIYRVWWSQRQWVQPEVFYRRTLKDRVGAFNERYNLAFDFDFWVRCFRAEARVEKLPEPLVQFRVHENQKSRAATQAADEIRAIVRYHLDDGAAISPAHRRRLEARLSYDRYQLGQAERSSFFRALLGNPSWLRAPEVRDRIRAACTRLFFPRKSLASNR
jgi:glycosyltransferase involved in cell wall biosynthesis